MLAPLVHRSIGCSCVRQIAREFTASPASILGQLARLGRHCLLYQQLHRPAGPILEPLALDGFQSFEFSQDHPFYLNVVVGKRSHFFYAFTEAELRRRGRMTARQLRRRAWNEARYGRPHPRAIELESAAALALAAPEPQDLELHTDEHTDYPRALRRLPHLTITHRTISSRAARVTSNPLFPVNLLDLLLRHSGSNHKRETIAFSKRRQSALERVAIFQVWRNYMKWFSERRREGTPAMRLGLRSRRLTLEGLLEERLFASRIPLPQRLARYYRREVVTRRIPNGSRHTLRFAF